MAAGVATGAAAGFVLNPLLFPAGAIAGGFYGNKVYCENAAKQMRMKDLGTRFDTEGTTCASCGAPKSKKGGLGNCYGCGKLFCSSCREKTFTFKVEDEEFSANLKVCDSCHEDLKCIKMSEADLGDDGSEPSAPLYDFSSFQAASVAGPVPSAFDSVQAPAATQAPAALAAVPAYACGLGHVPSYASGASCHSFNSPVVPAYATESPAAPGLYPSLASEPSAPPDDYGMAEVKLIPNLSFGSGDRLERVMTAASFFPDAPEDDLSSPSAATPSSPETSFSTLDLDTNTGPELQFACEQVANSMAQAPADETSPLEANIADVAPEIKENETPCDGERSDWEASWNLPPAVLAQRALEKLKLSEGSAEDHTAGSTATDAPAAAVADLFPSAPDHDISA